MQKTHGISHITLICQNLNKTANLFTQLFGAVEVYCGERRNFSISQEKFFLIGDLWIALMKGDPLAKSYNHIAFYIKETELDFFKAKIQDLKLETLPDKARGPKEGKSIYFYDYDNHLFELHTGDLTTRLTHYQSQTSP